MCGPTELGHRNHEKVDGWLVRTLPRLLVAVAIIGIALVVVVLGLYAAKFGGPLSSDHVWWGTFGDFFGGTLNPLLAFLSLIALLMTLAVQNRELAESKHALTEQNRFIQRQNFERTFFEMVRLHHQIVNVMDLRDSDGHVTRRSRDCFRVFYDKRFRRCYETSQMKTASSDPLKIIRESYADFYGNNQHEVGHYFRNLYRILKFVDDGPIDDKQGYASILRAQLSTYELALLFYNCLDQVGDKFKPFVEKYALLENMRVDVLLNPAAHIPLYRRSAFGDQDLSAYVQLT